MTAPPVTCNELADYAWLTGPEAAAIAAELAEDTSPLHAAVERLRRRLSPVRTHLVVELVDLRRRAAAKFAAADRMFFTRVALEQATDQWIAAYKADRFAPRLAAGAAPARAADLCCGIGGDLIALARRGPVVAIDQSAAMIHLAAANVAVCLPPGAAQCISFHTADVEQLPAADPPMDSAAWHIDPDRRPAGRRTSSPDWSSPGPAAIDRLLAILPHASVKLAPAADVPAEWADRAELEWISRDRECRQLVAWLGALATAPGRRRATIVAAAPQASNPAGYLVVRTIVGSPGGALPMVEQVDRYLFEPDPALCAARLTATLAREHNLAALAAGPTYFTGPKPIDDPAAAAFEVEDVLPLQWRRLAGHLRQRGIGRLEIKKRGLDVDPHYARRQLKPEGDRAATLLLTTVAGRPAAILARRLAAIGPHAL